MKKKKKNCLIEREKEKKFSLLKNYQKKFRNIILEERKRLIKILEAIINFQRIIL